MLPGPEINHRCTDEYQGYKSADVTYATRISSLTYVSVIWMSYSNCGSIGGRKD